MGMHGLALHWGMGLDGIMRSLEMVNTRYVFE